MSDGVPIYVLRSLSVCRNIIQRRILPNCWWLLLANGRTEKRCLESKIRTHNVGKINKINEQISKTCVLYKCKWLKINRFLDKRYCFMLQNCFFLFFPSVICSNWKYFLFSFRLRYIIIFKTTRAALCKGPKLQYRSAEILIFCAQNQIGVI